MLLTPPSLSAVIITLGFIDMLFHNSICCISISNFLFACNLSAAAFSAFPISSNAFASLPATTTEASDYACRSCLSASVSSVVTSLFPPAAVSRTILSFSALILAASYRPSATILLTAAASEA